MFYSASQNAFFLDKPSEIETCEITNDEHAQLLKSQSEGLVITTDTDGRPKAVSPKKTLSVCKSEKYAEIIRTRSAVLAYMLADTPLPSPVEAALAVADMGAEDPSGLAYVCALVDARRAELLAQVDAAQSLADVEVVVVSYPV